MAGQLEPPHEQQLHEVSKMQAGRSRVEPAVVRDGRAIEKSAELCGIRGDMDQSAPLKFLPQPSERVVVTLGT